MHLAPAPGLPFPAGVTKLFNNFWILACGRFLCGIATSLLFSTFEAWMVSEHTARGFDPALLSDTFGLATVRGNFDFVSDHRAGFSRIFPVLIPRRDL